MPAFNSPPDPKYFNALAWELVQQIPPGKVATYGQIATLMAPLILPAARLEPDSYRVQGARWVGGAMAACPPGVPWQRVINAQGKISLRQGSEHQRQLLEEEGVEFDTRQRVDLKRFGWEGPSPEWRKAHGL